MSDQVFKFPNIKPTWRFFWGAFIRSSLKRKGLGLRFGSLVGTTHPGPL